MKFTLFGKMLIVGWFTNLLLFTALLWVGSYYMQYYPWIVHPRQVTLASLGLVKILLTCYLIHSVIEKTPAVVIVRDIE